MKHANLKECEAAGLDPAEVERIAKGIARYAKQAEAIGLQIFGGDSGGDLRTHAKGIYDRALIVAEGLGSGFNGGAGSASPDEDGLLRGE